MDKRLLELMLTREFLKVPLLDTLPFLIYINDLADGRSSNAKLFADAT